MLFNRSIPQGTGANLEGVSLELMLLDWDRVTKNEVISHGTVEWSRITDTLLWFFLFRRSLVD